MYKKERRKGMGQGHAKESGFHSDGDEGPLMYFMHVSVMFRFALLNSPLK